LRGNAARTDWFGFEPNVAPAGTGTFSADVSGSLHWGGIQSVTDEFGNPINDWTITSQSGFDYSKPFSVPEPSSLLLLLMVLCARLALARSQR
jgi:hypothetical protein